MPAGRKKSTKSVSDSESPPVLSPQSTNPSTKRSISDTSDFEHFVRQTLTELQSGQRDLRNRIHRLEENINDSIEFQSKRIDALELKIKELDRLTAVVAKADKIMADHAEQLNKLERFSRRNNLRVIGFPQQKGEDCLDLSRELFKEKFKMPEVKLERAHRDGPKMDGKPQHLLIKLNCYQDKIKILQQQRQVLSNAPFFCVEDLTRADLQEKRKWSAQVSSAYKEGKKYRFVAGPSIGFCFITTKEMVGCCFTKSLTTAYAIAGMGSSLSYIFVPPLTNLFLDLYGWRGTTMLLGALSLHLAVCGALLKPPSTSPTSNMYQVVTNDEDEINRVHDPESSQGFCSCVTSVCASITRTFSLSLFTSVSYWLVTIISVLLFTMFTAWVVYYVPSTSEVKGFSLADSTHFVVIFGVGRLSGTLFVSPVVKNFGISGSYLWMGISLLGMSANYFVNPWLMSYWSIAVNMLSLGFFDSFACVLIDVISKDTVGTDDFGHALGWIGLKIGLIRSLFLYFPGLIFDTLGSYTLAFILMGGVQALAVLALLALVWIQRHR